MVKNRNGGIVSRDPAVVVSRILDAAQTEFMAVGFCGASTNTIVRSFGGSKATVFRYFKTKEKLLEAVTRRIASRWQESLSLDSIPDLPPPEWLELYATRVLAWILSEDSILLGRLAIAEGHKLGELSFVFEETANKPLQNILARQLAKWANSGMLSNTDFKRDARHYLDLVVGGPVSRALFRAPPMTNTELKRHIRRANKIFLSGCV